MKVKKQEESPFRQSNVKWELDSLLGEIRCEIVNAHITTASEIELLSRVLAAVCSASKFSLTALRSIIRTEVARAEPRP